MSETKMNGAVWGVALTQGEIDALAAGISPLLIRPDHLLEYVPLRYVNLQYQLTAAQRRYENGIARPA